MEFTILTHNFVSDLLYATSVALLAREYYDEFVFLFTAETRPSTILNDVSELLDKTANEPVLNVVKEPLKALKILIQYKDNANVIMNEIVDAVQQSCSYDLQQVISQIKKDLLDGSIQAKLHSIINRIKQRLNYLAIKDDLQELKQLITGEEVAQLETFLDRIKEKSKKIATKVETSSIKYEIFDTSSSNHIRQLVDDYKNILDPSQYISTGFPDLDRRLYGGFAKTRIYVVGGPSGHGKSTYLLNWLVKAIQSNHNSTFMYITLENIVPETMLRIASILNKKNVLDEALRNPDSLNEYLEQAALFLQTKGNRTIIKYFSPTTPIDVLIEDIKNYGKENPPIKALFYDYLNVMSLFSEDIRRHLGQMVRKLKDLAVELQIPVITAAQLNRDAYKAVNPNEVGLHNVAESMLIVENADVMLLTSSAGRPGYAFLQIKKRRYAREGMLYVKYNPDAYLVEGIREYDLTIGPTPQQSPPTNHNHSTTTNPFV